MNSNEVVETNEEKLLGRDQIINQKDFLLKEQDFNTYATSKSVSQNLLNMTSISNLITLLVLLFSSVDGGKLTGFQITLIVLISLSLSLQFIIFILLVVLANAKTERVTRSCTATSLNNTVTSLTGLLLIISTGITAVSINSDISK